MTNYELRTVKKLVMDYATLCAYNPAIIYAVLTAFGSRGPDEDETGHDWYAISRLKEEGVIL